MLHVTNGDSAASLIRATGLAGEILPWRDVLHEGPVPAGLSLAELRAVRARFIAGEGWGEASRVLEDFKRRDATLAGFREYGEVVLWFEHDLYDQLQILQILDFFAVQDPPTTALQLISIDRHPDVERFLGLGQLRPEQMAALFGERRAVSPEQLELARRAWRAFRDPDPAAIVELLERETSALPFLDAALRRHVEQFPSQRNGLGRTEQQALEGVASGRERPGELFRHDQDREESPFLGDSVFFAYLERLASGARPLLEIAESMVALTEDGRGVLEGDEDYVRLNGLDRWLGGVHLRGRSSWRWDGRLRGSGPIQLKLSRASADRARSN